MINKFEPLFKDEYTGEPAKRALGYIQSQREKGKHVVGIYCAYAPLELIRAINAVPAVLCAFANKTIAAAEAVLPANLCPLIKSSYGFIITDTCPIFAISEAVIAETTCDGKKKMFELISNIKPMHVMDLPQLPDEKEAVGNWAVMIKKLKSFLETTFSGTITDEALQAAIKDANIKNRLMSRVFDFAALKPAVISWNEIYDLTFLAQPASGHDIVPLLEECIMKLEKRVTDGVFHGKEDAPRVLVTGCPIGGDSTKVFKIIEEASGVVIALDSCTGMKTFMDEFEEDTSDPYAAISKRYLKIPCSCMTPNTGRLLALDKLIARFKPDVVIEVVLHACHSYNIESYKINEHVKNKHRLSYLKIETDYSQGDVEQIRTRVGALLESFNRV
jgi:benzoyl-CoA reductase/2-hydroxyglutaryl-CoA dehydratase subunit BcrC/BadD/HgdB